MTDYTLRNGNITKLIYELLFLRLRISGVESGEAQQFIGNIFKQVILKEQNSISQSSDYLNHSGKLIKDLLIDGSKVNPLPKIDKDNKKLFQILNYLNEEKNIKLESLYIVETLGACRSIYSGYFKMISSEKLSEWFPSVVIGNKEFKTINDFMEAILIIKTLNHLRPHILRIMDKCSDIEHRFNQQSSRPSNWFKGISLSWDKSESDLIRKHYSFSEHAYTAPIKVLFEGFISVLGVTGFATNLFIEDILNDNDFNRYLQDVEEKYKSLKVLDTLEQRPVDISEFKFEIDEKFKKIITFFEILSRNVYRAEFDSEFEKYQNGVFNLSMGLKEVEEKICKIFIP